MRRVRQKVRKWHKNSQPFFYFTVASWCVFLSFLHFLYSLLPRMWYFGKESMTEKKKHENMCFQNIHILLFLYSYTSTSATHSTLAFFFSPAPTFRHHSIHICVFIELRINKVELRFNFIPFYPSLFFSIFILLFTFQLYFHVNAQVRPPWVTKEFSINNKKSIFCVAVIWLIINFKRIGYIQTPNFTQFNRKN